MKTSELKLNDKNPRKISKDKLEKLKQSIQDFEIMMAARPIVIDSNNIILGGNMRFTALKALGYKEIPDNWVYKMEYLTDEQKKEFIIKDNVGFGEWDWDILKFEFDEADLVNWGLEFPVDMIEETILEVEEDDYEEPDNLKVDVVLGDLIEFECTDGRAHRLICGDSTDSDMVAKLMNGEKADMVFTDPPYGMNYQLGTTKNKIDKIIGDKESFNISEVWSIIFNIPTIYICTRFDIYVEWQNKIDRKVNNIIVWVKSNMGAGDLKNYGYQHEFIMYWGDKIDNKRDTNIWQEGNTPKNEYQGHPTQKPISLICRAINNHNAKNIFDLFLGSGSTMVAAHQLKRKCYGMELDPKYCQVIIDRMTKLDSTIKVKINGTIYEQTKSNA